MMLRRDITLGKILLKTSLNDFTEWLFHVCNLCCSRVVSVKWIVGGTAEETAHTEKSRDIVCELDGGKEGAIVTHGGGQDLSHILASLFVITAINVILFFIVLGVLTVNVAKLILQFVISIMINPLRKLLSFLNYWYFRYMLVTELYMVEKWERNFVNCFFVALFISFFVFNYKVLLPMTQLLTVNST